ncbi:MAG: hypothetical protein JNM07_02375 [Phycisphaerae bacterium]|nr:hypothetical protein [Phycisphaerae bacterium]
MRLWDSLAIRIDPVLHRAGLLIAVGSISLCGAALARQPELVPIERLGRELFFDPTLSEPIGQSCVSCHSPAAGFTFPISSINADLGVAPGVVPGRFGFRAVPQVSYAAFNPPGPPQFNGVLETYIGGQFWDGHANDLEDQARFPFLNPNEMNNLTHNVGDPSLVVDKVASGGSAALFKEVFGPDVFTEPTGVVFGHITEAIAAYERTKEVSPFSSKYDAWRAGRAELTPEELHGLRLVTGTYTGRPLGATFPRFAHCSDCHSIPDIPSSAPDLWTNTCYANIGVPRNPGNPFYAQTDSDTNPTGYNPLGAAFVDYGLGVTLYERLGLPPGNAGPGSNGDGDFLGINGRFKAPSLRNVDLRPGPGFVKAYMHNGALKSLEEVVHFYNTRNLTTEPGEVIDFTREDPYAGLRGVPLWGVPEYSSPETLQNPTGLLGVDPGTGPGGESLAQVGNLGMTPLEEAAIVAFLKTLSDGYFEPDSDCDCVCVRERPGSQFVGVGGTVRFAAASSDPASGYQWRHNGVPMEGETLPFYTIVTAVLSDAGTYDCVISSPCGSVTTLPATLTVCPADFNLDGSADDFDFLDFMDAFNGGELRADIDGDGEVSDADYFGFMSVFFGGC